MDRRWIRCPAMRLMAVVGASRAQQRRLDGLKRHSDHRTSQISLTTRRRQLTSRQSGDGRGCALIRGGRNRIPSTAPARSPGAGCKVKRRGGLGSRPCRLFRLRIQKAGRYRCCRQSRKNEFEMSPKGGAESWRDTRWMGACRRWRAGKIILRILIKRKESIDRKKSSSHGRRSWGMRKGARGAKDGFVWFVFLRGDFWRFRGCKKQRKLRNCQRKAPPVRFAVTGWAKRARPEKRA